MTTSLVTGAAGFIGSHLCELLLEKGHKVLAVDNLSTGKMENVPTHDRLEFFNQSVENAYPEFWLENVNYVFHLAAKADVVPSITAPEAYHKANVTATARLLESCREMPHLKKFVYAASSSCYGIPDPDDFPTTELSPVRCEYPYALTKNVAEQYVMHWSKVYKIPAISLRLFNVYGPRARTSGTYGAVFGVFLSQIANGLPVTIVGDGKQTRDFTYVSDVCNAFCLAAESRLNRRIFNIGSGGTYAVNQIADLLGAKEKVYIPKRPGEPGITFADICEARRCLRYQPRVTIEQGCEIMKAQIAAYKYAPLWTPKTIEKETKLWFELLGDK